MTRINAIQEAYLPLVTKAWAEEARVQATIRERLVEQLRIESAAVAQKTEDALAAAAGAGVPVRRIMQAVGTTNFVAIKERIARGMTRYNAPPEIGEDETPKTILDFLTLTQSPKTDSAWRVTSTNVPRYLWTYKPQGGDAYDVLPALHSAHLDVDKISRLVSIRGENSDRKGPLHLEWARGTSNIRDILPTVED